MKDKKLVSVVIPAYNCEKTISQTIQSVLNQTYSNIELIVVDDGSSDSTSKIISHYKTVKYFHQNNAGPATARNVGAQNANGEIVFFTDSDCVAHVDWIEIALKGFNDDVVVVAGSYGIANNNCFLAFCIYREILYRHTHLMPKYPKAFGSYNFGVKKKIFDDLGGFETSYRFASGEDNDLSYKIIKTGKKIFFEKNALVDHYHPEKVWKYLNEQYRHGFWRVKMYVDHPAMTKGDGYTFWKDIVEIPTAFVSVACLLLGLFGLKSFFVLSVLALISLFVIELVYGLMIVKTIFGAFFFGYVMFLRSFSRMCGFTSGILHYFFKKTFQKS